MEADHIVRQQPVVDRVAHLQRQDPPVVRLRPGNMDKVRERRVGRLLADDPRCQVEVIVLEENCRVRLCLELLEDCCCEALVDADVPLVPGVLKAVIDRGGVGELPEVVLEKPQHRVRDHVVEPVVGSRVVVDQAQAERRTVSCRLLDRLLGCDPVLVGDRARDPRHVVVGDQPAECRHEPAAAAAGDALAVLARVRNRPAVRDDNQPAPLPHRSQA